MANALSRFKFPNFCQTVESLKTAIDLIYSNPQCCIKNMAMNSKWSVIIRDIIVSAPFCEYPLW